ncbi:MAG: DUF4267 domain-containing protein [Candidatus Eremiobacteraeota bacterium]|nr:DUF4267 domain-containing protein [Candidatus Eremiobacteraeota bacterium]
MIGFFLAAGVALSYLGLGAGAAFAPRALAENYGLPATSATEIDYIRALGARDAVLGFLVAWCLASRDRDALGATIALSALVGASDFAVVLGARGLAARTSLGIHGGGTVGLLVVWQLVRAGR